MWLNGVGQNSETNEEHNKYCVKEGFQLARINLKKMVREAGKLLVWGNVVSIFEMDQNCN